MRILFMNRALRILLWTNGLILFAGAMLGPIYALYVEKVGGDLLDASFAGAIYAVAAGFTTLFSGTYSDKVKNDELIVVAGYIIVGIGFLAYLIVNSVLMLFVVQVIIGLGEAVYSPAYDSIYSKHLDGHKSGKQWGAWESMAYFIIAIGAVLGGYIVTKVGFNAMFILMALLCFASAVYILRLPRKIL